MALRALILVALFNAMLVSSIFHDVGGERFELRPTQEAMEHNYQVQANYVGMLIFVVSDAFVAMSFG